MAEAAPNTSMPLPPSAAATPPAEPQTPAETQTPVDPRKRLAAWYLLCGHRALWRLPLIPAVALLVGFLMLRGTFSDPQANLAESQRLIDEIKPAPVPDAENAALVYESAFAAVGKPRASDILWSDKLVGPNSVLLGHPATQSFFLASANGRQVFLNASLMEKCNWKTNFDDKIGGGSRSHLGEMRKGARLIAAHARWLAHRGDHAGAAAEIAAIYRMARHVGTDRTLIDGLVEIAMIAIADSAIQQIVLWDTPTNLKELEGYRHLVLAPRRPEERYVYFMQGERASALHNMDLAATGRADTAGLVVDAEDIKYAMIVLSADRECFKRTTQIFMDRVIAGQVSKTDRELASEYRRIAREVQVGPGQETGLMGDVIVRTLVSFRRCADLGRVTAAGLAFLAYRIRYGKDPASLGELVPEFLSEVPVGASDGKPLRMRIDARGMVFDSLNDRASIASSLDAAAGLSAPAKLEVGPAPGTNGGYCEGLVRIYSLGENGNDNAGFAEWNSTGEDVPNEIYAADPDRNPDDESFAIPPRPGAPNEQPEALWE